MKQFAKPALFALSGFGLVVVSLLATIATGRYFGVPQLIFIAGMGVMLFGVLLAYIRIFGLVGRWLQRRRQTLNGA